MSSEALTQPKLTQPKLGINWGGLNTMVRAISVSSD